MIKEGNKLLLFSSLEVGKCWNRIKIPEIASTKPITNNWITKQDFHIRRSDKTIVLFI